MPRGPELSAELHRLCYDLYVFKGWNKARIASYINNDMSLESKFGHVSDDGIRFHLEKIDVELEGMISEDSLEKYQTEFIRLRKGLENDLQDIDMAIELLEMEEKRDMELILKYRAHKHKVKVDLFKLLQDVELPVSIKRLKVERRKFTERFPTHTEVLKIEHTPDISIVPIESDTVG